MNILNKFNISICIITYKRVDDCIECVESLIQSINFSKNDEILILNNDTSSKELSKKYERDKKVKVYDSEKNSGVAEGRNKLVSLSKNNNLFFIDDDAILKKVNLKKRLLSILKNNKIRVIAVKSLNYYSGNINRNEIPNYNKKNFYCSNFIGVGHFFYKDDFLKFGGYDNSFFYGMEEFDYSYHVLKNDGMIFYTESITVLHKKNPEGRISDKNVLLNQALNKTKLAANHLPKFFIFSHKLLWFIKLRFKHHLKYNIINHFYIKTNPKTKKISFYKCFLFYFKFNFNPFY